MATQETAKTQYITAKDIKYAYRIIGHASSNNATTPPLLMLNHFRANTDLWDPEVINRLAATRQLITYDYAGMGHSGGEVARSVKGFSQNLIAFLTALLPSLNTTFVDVLGFSLGGFVAQQLVLDAPDLVRKLVLSGTGPSFGPHLERPMAEVNSAIMAPTPSGPAVIDTFFPSFIAKEAGEAWLNRVVGGRQAMAGKDDEPEWAFFLTGPGLSNLIEAYLKWDADPTPYALLSTVQKDVLVTAGQNDLIVPSQNSYILSRQLQRANFVLYPGSGHGHPFQYPEFYTKQVVSFLNGEWPTPPFSAGTIAPQ
ncbi:Alpha/Beta hydrolase protein [Clohesyomyces aquaticus]|uniref:Alpha/Beta hydrolase protein n=1 Tax=Clohesyomyces aquaticus TaxID=1231657 RepID=A0A1Y1ZY94_9PLEO|nr:Alpha/Beta hydrolase protein [Clohesyomyces aquaticus]